MLELAVDGLFGADYAPTRAVGGAGARRRGAARRPAAHRDRGARCALAALLGEVTEAQATARRRPPSSTRSDAELAEPPRRRGYLGAAEPYLDRFDDAAAHADRGLELARATGHCRRCSYRPSPRRGSCAAGSPTRRGSSTARWSARPGGHRPGARVDARASLADRRRRRRRRHGAGVRGGGLEQTAGPRRALHLGLVGVALAGALLPAGAGAGGRPAGAGRWRGAALHPGRLAGMALELLTRCRLALGRPTRPGGRWRPRRSRPATGLPLASRGPGGRPRRSRSPPATRAAAGPRWRRRRGGGRARW